VIRRQTGRKVLARMRVTRIMNEKNEMKKKNKKKKRR
jgi:hypothetical protein